MPRFIPFLAAALASVWLLEQVGCDFRSKSAIPYEPNPSAASRPTDPCTGEYRETYTRLASGGAFELKDAVLLETDCDSQGALLSPAPEALYPKRFAAPASTLSRTAVLAARQKFKAVITEINLVHDYGGEAEIPIHRVRVRLINGSGVRLPFLTLKVTDLFQGEKGWRRSSAPVSNLAPGQTTEVDFYLRGSIPRPARLTVEIEKRVRAVDEQFFRELSAN